MKGAAEGKLLRLFCVRVHNLDTIRKQNTNKSMLYSCYLIGKEVRDETEWQTGL